MVNSVEPVLTEVWRGPYREATHRGSVVVTSPEGATLLAVGSVDTPTLPRSALKPIQAIAMLRNGLDVTGAQLALVGASHSGEAFHLAAVADLLAGCGLGVDALATTPGLPLDESALLDWAAAGHRHEPLAHNCSGKHAGMLRTCVRAGWATDGYLAVDHPLQLAIRSTLDEFIGERVGDPVVDGCGAPAFAVSLEGLARAFGAMASAAEGPARAIADAFRLHPEYASGTRRDEVTFHREVPGLICKLGAEGAFAAGLADGTGIAVKIADGNHRGNVPVLVGILRALGLSTPTLDTLQPHPVLGHGVPVGRVTVSEEFDGIGSALAESRTHRLVATNRPAAAYLQVKGPKVRD